MHQVLLGRVPAVAECGAHICRPTFGLACDDQRRACPGRGDAEESLERIGRARALFSCFFLQVVGVFFFLSGGSFLFFFFSGGQFFLLSGGAAASHSLSLSLGGEVVDGSGVSFFLLCECAVYKKNQPPHFFPFTPKARQRCCTSFHSPATPSLLQKKY